MNYPTFSSATHYFGEFDDQGNVCIKWLQAMFGGFDGIFGFDTFNFRMEVPTNRNKQPWKDLQPEALDVLVDHIVKC